MANPCLQPKLSDFCGYPFEVYTETKTEVFYRNNCSGGQSGSGVSYSKNYVSNVSEEHLQQLIIADEAAFNTAGQANANSQGTCSSSCQASYISNPRYYPIAITPTNVVVKDSVLLTRADFLSSSLVGGNVLNNRTNWYTIWPHNDYSNLIGFEGRVVGAAYRVYGKTVSITPNACVVPTETLLWESPNNDTNRMGINSVNSLYFPNGVLMVMVSNTGGRNPAPRRIYLKWWDTSSNTITDLTVFQSPNGESHYNYNGVSLVYNGSTSVYAMISFKSPNSTKRTRTGFFRVVMSGGVPTGVVETIQGFNYSNQSLKFVSGVRAGSRIFFMYTEDGSWKFAPMEGTAPANTSSFVGNEMIFMRDPVNTHLAFGGATNRGGVLQYNNTTNTWTVIKTDG